MILKEDLEKFKELCKKESGKDISYEEALEIRDNLYGLAELAIESCIKEKGIAVVKISE